MRRELAQDVVGWLRNGPMLYDLGRRLDCDTPHSGVHPGVSVEILRRHGEVVRADGGSSAFEAVRLGCHTGTHVDAPSHIAVDGRLYGGELAAASETARGYSHGGVETVAPFVCEGVLLDIPGMLGREGLRAGEVVTGEMLDACCKAAGIEMRPGYAILVRIGRDAGTFMDLDRLGGHAIGVPGIDLTGAEWAIRHRARIVGCDTVALEAIPPTGFGSGMPVHDRLLCGNGTPILELLDLGMLARDRIYRFLFVCSPLCIVNASGSPVRPLALL